MTVEVDGQVTLREAIQAANMNRSVGDAPAGTAGLDTIQFAPSLSGQTITNIQPAGMFIFENLMINGPGADLLTISGGGNGRIFNINPPSSSAGVEVTISGLTLTNGNAASGGAILNEGTCPSSTR